MNRYTYPSDEPGRIPLLAEDAFVLHSKSRPGRELALAIFQALTLSQQERIVEGLGWKRAQEGAQEPQEGHQRSMAASLDAESRLSLLIDSIFAVAQDEGYRAPQGERTAASALALVQHMARGEDASHKAVVHQWESLKAQAGNFALDLTLDAEGFAIQRGEELLAGPCASLYELRRSLSDYVAMARSLSLGNEPQEAPLVITMRLRAVPKMTPEEASAWKKAHPEEAARIEESIREWKRLYPEMFIER